MLFLSKRFFISAATAAALAFPTLGLCDIWTQTQKVISTSHIKMGFEQVRTHLPLLTEPGNIVAASDKKDTWIIAGGYIVVDPGSIRSYKNPTDFKEGAAPEFEYSFQQASLPRSFELRKDLKGVRITLDIIPQHPYFKDLTIGEWNYDKFVFEIQNALAKSLDDDGAIISFLRPKIDQINAGIVNEINENPPHIVISPQFNNDQQDCMVTFCGGNISAKELAVDRQRARFIESAVTGKALNSANLGACIAKHCQEKLKVQPLDWKKASFEGNAYAVAEDTAIPGAAHLQKSEGKLNGIAMRNLVHNGIFAQAVAVPFPDMKWIRDQVQPKHELEWINQYTQAIKEGVLDYLSKTPLAFDQEKIKSLE
jgi:hypothetical protein